MKINDIQHVDGFHFRLRCGLARGVKERASQSADLEIWLLDFLNKTKNTKTKTNNKQTNRKQTNKKDNVNRQKTTLATLVVLFKALGPSYTLICSRTIILKLDFLFLITT